MQWLASQHMSVQSALSRPLEQLLILRLVVPNGSGIPREDPKGQRAGELLN